MRGRQRYFRTNDLFGCGLNGAIHGIATAGTQALPGGGDERNRDVAAGMSVVEVANKAYFRRIGDR